MNANACPLRWTLAATLLGCLLWTAAPALGQPVEEDIAIVQDEEGEANGGVSLGVLAGVGLNDGDSGESGRYLAADLSFVRPIGSLFGRETGRLRGFERSDAVALRRRRADVDSFSGGIRATGAREGPNTWNPPMLPPPDKRGTSASAQEERTLDHGGTLLGVIDLLLVFPVQNRFQIVPFAGVGVYRVLEGDEPEASNEFTLAGQGGLVLDYGFELVVPVGILDVRAQYRGFRYQVDELEYVGAGGPFEEEVGPVSTSALLIGLGINF